MRRIFVLLLTLVGFGWGMFNHAQAAPIVADDAYGFAAFWQANGGETLFGQAITSAMPENGLTVQYFERARFEYHSDTGAITLGLLGRERTQWRSFAPQAASANEFRPQGSAYGIRGAFRTFWEQHNGAVIFGAPISPMLWETMPSGRFQVQYFERALLIHHPLYAGQSNEIEIAQLGREVAAARGLIEGAVDSGPQMFEFDPVPPAPEVVATPEPASAPQPTVVAPPKAAPKPAPTAKPVAPTAVPVKPKPAAPSGTGKRIEVDISKQWLYAYQDGEIVFDAPVATGKDGFNTPTGSYEIYAKVPLQTMRGSINGESWVVPNVPHAMYFNGSVALHGTYWHNLFGSGVRISHGCVNLSLDAAAWMYDWAPVGTPVNVHY